MKEKIEKFDYVIGERASGKTFLERELVFPPEVKLPEYHKIKEEMLEAEKTWATLKKILDPAYMFNYITNMPEPVKTFDELLAEGKSFKEINNIMKEVK